MTVSLLRVCPLNCRHSSMDSLMRMTLSLVVLLALQWLATGWGPLTRILGTVPLVGGDWLVLVTAVLWPVGVLEGIKAWRRRSRTAASRPIGADPA